MRLYNSDRFTGKRSKRDRFVSSISIILSTLHLVSHGYIVRNVIRWFTIKPALKWLKLHKCHNFVKSQLYSPSTVFRQYPAYMWKHCMRLGKMIVFYVTDEKNAKHLLSGPRIEPGSFAWQSDTLLRRYKSRLVPQDSTSVYYILDRELPGFLPKINLVFCLRS